MLNLQRCSSVPELARIRDKESCQVFCKLMEILCQTRSMQEKLASVISRFDQITNKTPNQQDIFYDNVRNLQKKLNNQENLLKEKLQLHVIKYIRNFENRKLCKTSDERKVEEFPARNMEGQTSSITAPPSGPASLTKAQKNACNRIRKIRDKLTGTNAEALNVLEKIQRARTTRH